MSAAWRGPALVTGWSFEQFFWQFFSVFLPDFFSFFSCPLGIFFGMCGILRIFRYYGYTQANDMNFGKMII